MATAPGQPADPSVSIPLRWVAQVAVAALLAFPTAALGHLLAFGLAKLGEIVGPQPIGNVCLHAGEGLAASICLALFLIRIRLSIASRIWCWISAFILWVGAMPFWYIPLATEKVLFALMLILLGTSFLMWVVWLPWWRPQPGWPFQRLPLTLIPTNT